MQVIINELSLQEQFIDTNSFAKSVERSLKLLDILNNLNAEILKKTDFYSTYVIPGRNLYTVIAESSYNDTIRALRSNIINWCISKPYWDQKQAHTCDDEYKCKYTDAKCNYGLAEAVECDKIVFSFEHDSFKSDKLVIQKNKTKVSLHNLGEIKDFTRQLLSFVDGNTLKLNKVSEHFPKMDVCKKILEYCSYKKLIESGSVSQKRLIYIEFGKLIACINGWRHSTKLSGINKRNTYTKYYNGNYYNLELDTRHGTFELYQNGVHQGEYTFACDKHKNAINGRSTTYK